MAGVRANQQPAVVRVRARLTVRLIFAWESMAKKQEKKRGAMDQKRMEMLPLHLDALLPTMAKKKLRKRRLP